MTTKNPTLLIVDDDESQRWFLQTAFERAFPGHTIYALSSGNEAVAYLGGEGKFANRRVFPFPSSVITDLKMPDGDGFTILEFLRRNPALSVVPVVVLSGSDDCDDIRHAYLLGANAYFVKPAGHMAWEALARKIHDYWVDCKVPAVDKHGYAIQTSSRGKLGERFPKPKRATAAPIMPVSPDSCFPDYAVPHQFPQPRRNVPERTRNTETLVNSSAPDTNLT